LKANKNVKHHTDKWVRLLLFSSEAYMIVFILYKNNRSYDTQSRRKEPWREF
jgi:hypothetical protein